MNIAVTEFNIENKVVLLTGSRGFLGSFVKDELVKNRAYVLELDSNDDLTTEACVKKYGLKNIDYIIHLAGYNGGIAFNQTYPFDIFSKNTVIAVNILKIAIKSNCKKFLSVLTSCGYPPNNGSDIYEETYLDDKPHESISSHGYAKRNLLIACQMANIQYGLNSVCVVPNTIYGPGDSIDPIKTKVMMALIKKFVDAKENNLDKVILWGTGEPIREFIYVEDVAKLLVESLKNYNDTKNPLNLSTGQFYSIKDLSIIISNLTEYNGLIEWDISKPNGQMQKILNTSKMKKFYPEFIPTEINTGIKNTINWYKNNKL